MSAPMRLWRWLRDGRPSKRAALMVDSSEMKMFSETLRIAQSRCHRSPHDRARIGALLAEVDRHRPISNDGKHGDQHTRTCGCFR